MQEDPHEIRNLADSPDHQAVLQRMRGVHRRWTLDTHDTGLLREAEMYLRSEGRAPYEVVRDADAFPRERIFEAADLVGRGPAARSRQIALLADPDGAVRYWAAVGLTALGPEAQPAADGLQRLLEDASPDVRLAAAEALSNVGREKKALPVIVEGLKHESGWVRLHAAVVLVAIGQKARDAAPQIKQAIE